MDEFRRRPVNKVQQPGVAPRQTINPTPSQPQPQAQPQPLSSAQAGLIGQPQPVAITPQPLNAPTGIAPNSPKKSKKKAIIWSIIGFFVVLAMCVAGAFVWYTSQLSAVDSSATDKKLVKIESGSTPAIIAQQLDDEGLIKNQSVFLWQARIKGVQNKLQAGSYRLSPSESTPEIIDHLSNGKVDTFSITFLPGSTLEDNRKSLIGAGYSEEEVNTALSKEYDSPLFDGRPATADLEGYIYAETYSFGTDTTVEQILEHTFEKYYEAIRKNNLIAGFKSQNLTLFEGINMASIIEKEAVGGDEPQIAQVFLQRYNKGMELGSDPTYQYITDKLGVPRDINYDSPYNTRRYPGLPPGPIATPGITALKAVANPAPGDYEYFLSGDDDVTYFSRTFAEHEANIIKHCKVKCQAL